MQLRHAIGINQSTYAICNDGSKLINFVLFHVNKNGTVTGLLYPPFIIPLINASLNSTNAYKRTFSIGQQVGFSCSGYVSYLYSTNYPNQSAVFKVVKTHPIPCPANAV